MVSKTAGALTRQEETHRSSSESSRSARSTNIGSDASSMEPSRNIDHVHPDLSGTYLNRPFKANTTICLESAKYPPQVFKHRFYSPGFDIVWGDPVKDAYTKATKSRRPRASSCWSRISSVCNAQYLQPKVPRTEPVTAVTMLTCLL